MAMHINRAYFPNKKKNYVKIKIIPKSKKLCRFVTKIVGKKSVALFDLHHEVS